MFNEDESINDPSFNIQDDLYDNSELNGEINPDESSISISPKIQLKKFKFRDVLGLVFLLLFFLPPIALSFYLSILFMLDYNELLIIKKILFIIVGFLCSVDNVIKVILLYLYGIDNRPTWVIVFWIIFTFIDISDSIFSNIIREDLKNFDKNIYNNIIMILLINILKSIFIFLSDLGLLKGCKI